MVDPAAQQFFSKHQEEPLNNVCVDSGSAAPQWASVSHGIYLSIGASGVHRSLGVRVSFVQSTTMDSWRPVHLRMMELGGNQRFQDFLDQQGIPRDMPIREKYQTRAAAWYRQNLRALAEGATPPEPLPTGTGHLSASDAANSTQQLLDQIFAKAPCADAMTKGGIPAIGVQSSRDRVASRKAKKCALAHYLVTGGKSRVANASSVVADLQEHLWALLASGWSHAVEAAEAEEVGPAASSRSRSRSGSPRPARR